jgi:hypothetical protein
MAMSDTVRMRFTRSYQIYHAGQEYDFTPGLARSLELIRVAVRVQLPEVQTATAPPPAVEQAEAPVAKAARRRRRRDV